MYSKLNGPTFSHIICLFYLFILVHSIHQTRGHSPEDIEHVTVV